MQSLPPPERRPSLLQGFGVLLSALLGLALTVGMFAVGAVLVAVVGGMLLLTGAGIALALRLGWNPAILRQATAWPQSRRRDQPLDGEYTVIGRDDRESRG
jgi:hypothetical protein